MTEPIKLPPLGRAVGIWAPAYGENEVRDYACRAVESYKATTELPPIDLFNLPPDVKKVAQSYARLAVEQNIEQATADLREQVEVLQSRAEVQNAALACVRNDFRECAARAEKAEAERDEARKDRDDVLASYADACKQLLEAEKAGDEARAELARLTTVAHKHEWFRTGAMEPGQMRCISCGVWGKEETPLPPVKEADK